MAGRRRQDHGLHHLSRSDAQGPRRGAWNHRRTAIYTFRQLNDMKTGNRIGPWVELMKPVVAKLSQDDMIALAAFLGSLDP